MQSKLGIGALSNVGVRVSNMETSLRFYEQVLGFQSFKEIKMSGDEVKDLIGGTACDGVRCMLGWVGSVCVELVEYLGLPTKPRASASAIQPLPDFGPHHFALVVDDVDRMYEHCASLGVRCLSGVQAMHGNKAFMIVDPDGTRIEFLAVGAGQIFASHPEAAGLHGGPPFA